ncbi:MAG: hypothetical protein FWC92_11550 [Defluviitaleaceae bacterium]|nr:hypothetical protein [Defluviitaleaceae bacterium]
MNGITYKHRHKPATAVLRSIQHLTTFSNSALLAGWLDSTVFVCDNRDMVALWTWVVVIFRVAVWLVEFVLTLKYCARR